MTVGRQPKLPQWQPTCSVSAATLTAVHVVPQRYFTAIAAQVDENTASSNYCWRPVEAPNAFKHFRTNCGRKKSRKSHKNAKRLQKKNDVCLFFSFPVRFGRLRTVHPSSSLVTLVRTYRHTATRQSPPTNEKLKRR